MQKHGDLQTKLRKQGRFRCKVCGKTASANAGTVYHKLHSSPAVFDRVVALSVEGMSQAAIARVVGKSVSTIRRWLKRAAEYARDFNDHYIRGLVPVELQADELKTYAGSRKRVRWVYTSISVWSRVWATLRVGRRTRRNTILHFRDLRERCSLFHEVPYLVTDSFKYNEQAVKETFGARMTYAQVEKSFRGNRVIRKRERLVIGGKARLDAAMSRSEDSKTINTAYVERLNLTLRRSIAALQRKTTAQAQKTETLWERMEILRCYYNFIRPHSSLRFGKEVRTPAQQAELVDRRLKWRDVFLLPKHLRAQVPLNWRVESGPEVGLNRRRGYYA